VTGRTILLAAALAVATPLSLAIGQTGSMVGTVKDSLGRPVVDAELQVGNTTARTDTLGRYYIAFPRTDSITVHVRRMGFERVTFTVSAQYVADNTVEIRLRQVAQTLAEVQVEDRAPRSRTEMKGFDYRRANATGVFLTHEQIKSRGTEDLSNILRGERGIEVVRTRGGRQTVRFAQWRGKPGCEPQIWVDGQLARGAGIDDFPASSIEAIELYDGPSTTPGEFIRGPNINCGSIVLWTRVPLLQDRRRP
jgi:hypothetical protein